MSERERETRESPGKPATALDGRRDRTLTRVHPPSEDRHPRGHLFNLSPVITGSPLRLTRHLCLWTLRRGRFDERPVDATIALRLPKDGRLSTLGIVARMRFRSFRKSDGEPGFCGDRGSGIQADDLSTK